MVSALLRVENLVKHFPLTGSRAVVRAVNDVTFDVGRGETLGLVGESGSGKTTVGRCVLGLIEPTDGKVYFHDNDIFGLRGSAFRKLRPRLQLVFQDPYDSLDPRRTAFSAIAEPLSLAAMKRRQREERVFELARLVGLPEDLLFAYPHELSGGQQQRVGMARSMAMEPEFVVLDEPTSLLDSLARAEIINTLIDLQNRLGVAYLFISHDLMTVRQISSRVAVMYLGKIVETAPTEELFARPMHPYSKALISSFLPANPEAKLSEFALAGEIPSPINLPQGCHLYSRCPLAQPECRTAFPPLVEVGPDHFSACYRTDEMAKYYQGVAKQDARVSADEASSTAEGSS